MDEKTEESLVSAAVDGERDAVAELLARHGETVRLRLRGKLSPRWQSVLEVDDVLQVTFLEVFLRIGRFEDRGPGSFEAWLNRIADNNLMDAVRALDAAKRLPPEKRIVFPEGGESSVALLDAVGFTTGTPSRQAVAAETLVELRKAISKLPRDYERVLTLYDLEGQPISTVAQHLGRSPGAIYMLRARALDYLRESMASA
ncbi:MAG: sigma-70 family RNA polymerase sigma factor [Planctomycetota bacterium]